MLGRVGWTAAVGLTVGWVCGGHLYPCVGGMDSCRSLKGSLHEKKTEIVWSFAKPGGGNPPTKQILKYTPPLISGSNGF